jgi:hypothetical protein
MDATAPIVSGNYVGMVAIFDVPSQQWLPVGGGLEQDSGVYGDCHPVPQACPNGRIEAMTSDSATNIYIAGNFKTLGNGTAAYHVAKWSGRSQTWTSLAPNRNWCYFAGTCSPQILSIAVSASTIYVTGNIFPPCGATYPQSLAEFSLTGSGLVSNDSDNLWVHLQSGPGAAQGIGLCVKGCYVYVTGPFDMIGSSDGTSGVSALGIGRKNGFWLPLSTGLKLGTNPSFATSLAADTYNIYVLGAVTGGDALFDSAGGVSTINIARWANPNQ